MRVTAYWLLLRHARGIRLGMPGRRQAARRLLQGSGESRRTFGSVSIANAQSVGGWTREATARPAWYDRSTARSLAQKYQRLRILAHAQEDPDVFIGHVSLLV